jgi:hypothetical protein
LFAYNVLNLFHDRFSLIKVFNDFYGTKFFGVPNLWEPAGRNCAQNVIQIMPAPVVCRYYEVHMCSQTSIVPPSCARTSKYD